MCALYHEGSYFCGKLDQIFINDSNINMLDKPDNFKEDIKHISGMRSICAVKNSGELGCWDPNSLLFNELI